MFAHQIDLRHAFGRGGAARRGQPTAGISPSDTSSRISGDFMPDPTECAVYIVRQNEKALFDEADYLITDFGNFAAVYPRYCE
ncbi:MAG: hypothetical protein ACLUI3_12610 [Christensenellales bacterium]